MPVSNLIRPSWYKPFISLLSIFAIPLFTQKVESKAWTFCNKVTSTLIIKKLIRKWCTWKVYHFCIFALHLVTRWNAVSENQTVMCIFSLKFRCLRIISMSRYSQGFLVAFWHHQVWYLMYLRTCKFPLL